MTIDSGNTIRTSSGIYFDLESPKANDVRLLDIAYSLAKECRYTGQIGYDDWHYSVAEHSVLCVQYAFRTLKISDETILRSIFLHDASEAYTGDINKPLKDLIRQHTDTLDVIEKGIDRAIAERFRCDFEKHHEVIKQADSFMLFTEKRYFFWQDAFWKDEQNFIPSLGYIPRCLSPKAAAELFLEVAEDLRVV